MVGVGVTEKGRFCSSFVPAKLVLIASAHFRNLDVPNKISKFTFAIFKPEIAKNAFAVNYAYNVISKKGLIVAKTESLRFSVDLANKFYQVHDGKFFHQRLVESITRGPVICSVLCDLEKQNAVRTWRDIIGPTKVRVCSCTVIVLTKAPHNTGSISSRRPLKAQKAQCSK